MSEKLQTIDNKRTMWGGLWWHPEYNGFSSQCIDLAQIRKFKGKVRLYVRKNKFYNKGENNRPNYKWCLQDADAGVFDMLDVEDIESVSGFSYNKDGEYRDEDGNRLFTRQECRTMIDGAFYDGYNRVISDPWDILPEDFV